MTAAIKQWADLHIKGDQVIWAIVITLSIISIAVVYSATGALAYRNMQNVAHYLFKHTGLIILSLVAMWVAHKIDYRYYSKLSKFGLWLSVPLLIYAWKAGVNLNDASRWITIPIINQVFQPSDLAKLSLIAAMAAMLSKRQQNIGDCPAFVCYRHAPDVYWPRTDEIPGHACACRGPGRGHRHVDWSAG